MAMERSRIYLAICFAALAVATWTISKSEGARISATATASHTPLRVAFDDSPSAQSSNSTWNILHHLGGNGPWIQKTDNVVEGGIDIPESCRVDQVHMISRHAERYPTIKAGIRMLELYHRLSKLAESDLIQGDLSFVKRWSFLTGDPSSHLESLVPTGPYAGTLQAFRTGVELRTRYSDLHDQALTNKQTNLWASGSKRVIETARYFASGFYGLDFPSSNLHIISETAGLGGDTLTPGDTCKNYANNVDDYGHDYGYRMLAQWQNTYIPPIVARLEQQNPGVNFTNEEVYVMQEICGFETLAKGKSNWCDVFSHEEWEQFEYARDILHFYRSGPGNKYGATMGWLFLNATTDLLEQGPEEAGPLFFSFVHDGDVTPLLSALPNLFTSHPLLPPTHLLQNRTFRTSSLAPMSSRIFFERLVCQAPMKRCWRHNEMYPHMVYCDPPVEETFVRIVVNDGVIDLGCGGGEEQEEEGGREAGGEEKEGEGRGDLKEEREEGDEVVKPRGACGLVEWGEMVRRRGREVGDFREVCGLGSGDAEGISFLHQ